MIKHRFQIRVQPNAKHSGWVGMWNGTHYKIALQAPAVDGKANDALIEFLADYFQLPKHAISILSGQKNRCKLVEVLSANPLEAPCDPVK